MKDEFKRGIDHMLETSPIRRLLWHMDDKVEDLLYGIRQGDDAVIVGDMIYNMEGPYPMNIGRKTGLLHTCTDIVAMGGRPLYAFNAMQVDTIAQAKEVLADLKKQSNGVKVPILGGNTQMENNLKPCVSFTVVGKLVRDPVADCGARIGDKIMMLGHVMEGPIGERVYRANVKFKTMMQLYEQGVEVHAAKDASRGGWFGNLTEMMVKSARGVKVSSIPYASPTRYMGTFLVAVPKKEADSVVEAAVKNKCPCVEIGQATRGLYVKVGDDTVVSKSTMTRLIRGVPYRKPKR